MCYSLSQRFYKSYQAAKKDGTSHENLRELYVKFMEQYNREQAGKDSADIPFKYYYVNGFDHPKLMVITNDRSAFIQEMEWGFIPPWVKDKETALKMSNVCLNARGETIFEKPAFREAIETKRCLIVVDSFFEYQHRNRKKYPHRIKRADGNDLLLAGIWAKWLDPEIGESKTTCSIVTTKANNMMAEIHNNPQLKEPRMPLILSEKEGQEWLLAESNEKVETLIKSAQIDLVSHTVGQLTGDKAVGNSSKAHEEHIYPELVARTLFD